MNATKQQLLFAVLNIGEVNSLQQVICGKSKTSNYSSHQACRDIILKHNVLASPGEYEDDGIILDIICKGSQIESITSSLRELQLPLVKQTKADPWMIQSSITSYVRVKLQSMGWNKMCGLLIKGDLFSQEPTKLIACEMEMHLQQGESLNMSISVSHPHTVRYKPLNVTSVGDCFPPPQCIVMPTMSTGFICKIQKFPPLGNQQFRNEQDFKAYWFKTHGLVLPEKIESYAKVRMNDMELTYPSCCLWDSKLSDVRSYSEDTSLIVSEFINDMKSIELYSCPLLRFEETETAMTPKVAWMKSSEVFHSASKFMNAKSLPNVEPLVIKPPISKPEITIEKPPVLNATEKPSLVSNEKSAQEPPKIAPSEPKIDIATRKDTKEKVQQRDPSRKRTLGIKRSKQAEIQPGKSTIKAKRDTANAKKDVEPKNKIDEVKSKNKPIESPKSGSDSNVAISGMLAFDDVLAADMSGPADNRENTPKDETQKVGTKHKIGEPLPEKQKRAKVEVDKLGARTVHELQAFCRKESLKLSGTKSDLVSRVRAFLEKGS